MLQVYRICRCLSLATRAAREMLEQADAEIHGARLPAVALHQQRLLLAFVLGCLYYVGVVTVLQL